MSWQHYLENNLYCAPYIPAKVYVASLGLHKITVFFPTAKSICAGSCKISELGFYVCVKRKKKKGKTSKNERHSIRVEQYMGFQ